MLFGILSFCDARPTAEIYTLSLHDALPISSLASAMSDTSIRVTHCRIRVGPSRTTRSEEHTSELQSPVHLVCRLLLEKNNDRSEPHHLPRHGPGGANHGLSAEPAAPHARSC